jgi:Flp pilus assembly protein TadG
MNIPDRFIGWSSTRSRRLMQRLSTLLVDRVGTVGVTTALATTGLLGVGGLSIDVGDWYMTRRAMQTAADAGAISGARELAAGHTGAAATAAAQADTTLNGFTNGTGGTAIAVTPVASPLTVTVSISKPADMMFSGLFLASSPTIQVNAQAGLAPGGSPVCLLTLSPNAAGAILLNGNASITMPGCALVVNSSDAQAIIANGNDTVTTGDTCGPGGYHASGHVTFSPTPSNCPSMSDPLAGLAPPPNAHAPCDHTNLTYNGSVTRTVSPGVYCGGIRANGNVNIHFQPGVYVMRDGGLQVNGNGNLTGAGVGFYMTGAGSSVMLNGNGAVQFSAPTSGPLAGLIFDQDPATPANSVMNTLNGNANVRYEGTMYFGRQNVTFNGNGSMNSLSPYTMVVANTMTFNGNGTMNFNSDFAASSVPPPAGMSLPHVALTQ